MDLENLLGMINVKIAEDKGDRVVVSCISPSHRDSNPSMTIWKEFPFGFSCFGCGYSGSLAGNSKEIFGKGFREVTDKNYKEVVNFSNIYTAKKKEKRDSIKPEIIGEIKSPYLIPECRDYVFSRGISEDFIRHFNVFAVEYAEISVGEKVSKWYKRLVIPVHDHNGSLISYEGRDYTRRQSRKCLYPKGTYVNNTLFNYHDIDKNRDVKIVEGVMGLSSVWEYDRNVVAVFGKAIRPEQAKLICALKHMTIIPDNDWDKGVDNVEDTLLQYEEFYPREYNIAIIDETGADPNDIRENIGKLLEENVFPAYEYIDYMYGEDDRFQKIKLF